MKLIMLMLVAIMFGCIPMEQPEPPPRRFRPLGNRSTTIIVASRNGCEPCERQMKVLSGMRGISARKVNHSTCSAEEREDYPASSFPTLYIYSKSGVKIAVGFKSESEIKKLIE